MKKVPASRPTAGPLGTDCTRRWPSRASRRWLVLASLLAPLGASGAGIYVVDSRLDNSPGNGNGIGNTGDLRYCLTAANADPGSTVYLGNQTSAIDTIVLARPLPVITAAMTISRSPLADPGVVTAVDGAGLYRGFFVDVASAATVTIADLRIQNCRAQGGEGGRGGGGGGLGAGGAIFVNSGQVVLTNVTFSGNAAVGGAGGLGGNGGGAYLYGGGGGGLGGKGGDGGIGSNGIELYSGGGGGFGGAGGTIFGGGGGIVGNGGNGFIVTPGMGGTANGLKANGGGGGALANGGNASSGNGGLGASGAGNGGRDNPSTASGAPGTSLGGGGGSGTSGDAGSHGGAAARYAGGGGASFTGTIYCGIGGVGGDFGGGGGGYHPDGGGGGAGGYGGGGGGAPPFSLTNSYPPSAFRYAVGGNGGFGAGAGGAATPNALATPGLFGGGSGFSAGSVGARFGVGGGGGGGALGGNVFVRGGNGASLTITGGSMDAGAVTPGAGGPTSGNSTPGSPGQAAGSGLFSHGATVVQLVINADRTYPGSIGNEPGGSLQIVKSGGAALTLSGANTFTGGIFTQSGLLRLGSATGLGNSSNFLTLNTSGLDLNGFSPTIGALSGNAAGSLTNLAAGAPAVLTIGGAPGGATADFPIFDGPSPISLVKSGPGQQTLNGLSSFSGGTTVSGGTLTLTGADNNGFGTIVGAVSVGPGAFLRPIVQNAFGYANGRKVNSVAVDGGTLANDSTGDQGWGVAYTLSNGALMQSNGGTNDPFTTGKWSFGGPGAGGSPNATSSVLATGTGTSIIRGRIDLRGDNGNTANTFTVHAGARLSVEAFITQTNGTLALFKEGPGTLALAAGNTYRGGTVVNGGTLELAHSSNGLGTLRGSLTINSGATVSGKVIDAMGYNFDNKVNSVVINGTGILSNDAQGSLGWGVAYQLNGGILRSNGGVSSTTAASNLSFGGLAGEPTSVTVGSGAAAQIQGRVELRVDNGNLTSTLNVGSGAMLTVSAGVSGAGGLSKTGAGTLVLSGANTFSGGTALSGGTLSIASGAALGTGSLVFSGGHLQFASGFTGNLAAVLGSTGTGAFQLDTNGQNVTATSAIGGTRGLTKVGAGTLTLSAAQTYTGATTVGAGTLALGSGASLAGGSVTVSAGATLNNAGVVAVNGGSFTLNGNVVNSGTIRLTGGATLPAGLGATFVNNGVLDLLSAAPGLALPPGFSNGVGGIVLTGDLVRVKDAVRNSGNVTIRIDGYTGHTYRLQRSSSLSAGNFADLAGVPAQNGSTGSVLTFVDLSPAPTAGFYRIVLD